MNTISYIFSSAFVKYKRLCICLSV